MVRSNLKAFSQVAQEKEEIKPGQVETEMIFPEPVATDVIILMDEATKEKPAMEIVKKNMLWAMGAGILPIPFFFIVTTTGFLVKMLKELSDLYDIPFSEHAVKNLAGSLLGGLGSLYLAKMLTYMSLTFLPVIGPITFITAIPLMVGAAMYATGKVFIQHFESGGTFLTFKPKEVRQHFREQFKKGIKFSAELKKGQDNKL